MGLTKASEGTRLSASYQGPVIRGSVDFTFDSSYPTGGEAIAASDIDANFTGILELHKVANLTAAACAYSIEYDAVNGKLMAYDAGGQVADTTDLSGVSVRLSYVCY